MGVIGGAGNTGGTGSLGFFQSVDVRFAMTGETDGGLTFGATIDLEDAVDQARLGNDIGGTQGFADFTVFVSGAFGTLTMGDTNGAFDEAMQEVNIGGTISDDQTSHPGYNGNGGLDGFEDGQVARYDYAINGLTLSVSAELDDPNVTVNAANSGNTVFGVGAAYVFEGISAGTNLTLGAGYQSAGAVNIYGASVGIATDSGFTGIVNYSKRDGAGAPSAADFTHYGIGVGYTMNALTLSANYGSFDFETGGDSSGYGLVANYDLGGAELQAGYANGTARGVGAGNERYSLGIAMTF